MTITEHDIEQILGNLFNERRVELNTTEQYKKIRDFYFNKAITDYKLKNYNVIHIAENGVQKYTYTHINNKISNNIKIEVYPSLAGKIYPFSVSEVLTVLDFYGLLDVIKSITINNREQPNVQAFVKTKISNEDKNQINKDIVLFVPNLDGGLKKRLSCNITDKQLTENSVLKTETLAVLLHETSHALGNIYSNPLFKSDCENEADAFARTELKKWLDYDILNIKQKEEHLETKQTDQFGF